MSEAVVNKEATLQGIEALVTNTIKQILTKLLWGEAFVGKEKRPIDGGRHFFYRHISIMYPAGSGWK